METLRDLEHAINIWTDRSIKINSHLYGFNDDVTKEAMYRLSKVDDELKHRISKAVILHTKKRLRIDLPKGGYKDVTNNKNK